ncbi:MAG: hypothetical protein F2923_03385 [Actinobacteria bacterium]|nr:hypothetical protein [Actinomycetota bacterium]MTB27666.1 hypothetical protein [Actinomycetota bacterium]
MTDGPNISDPADDDAYSALFRPAPAPVAPAIEPEAAPKVVALEPESLPEPEFTSPSADTGRLFRSRGADASSGALAALAANQVSHLRTMSAESAPVQPIAEVATPAPIFAGAPALNTTTTSESASGSDQVFGAPIQEIFAPEVSPKESQEMAKSRRVDPGLNPLGVYIIVIGTTLIAGFLDSFISGTGLGWLTGIALLAASVFCAIRVRVSDASVAVIAPPLAYGIAAITVGQLGQSRAGGAFISAFVNGFFTLADNWFWVISTTLIALAIVVVRARR